MEGYHLVKAAVIERKQRLPLPTQVCLPLLPLIRHGRAVPGSAESIDAGGGVLRAQSCLPSNKHQPYNRLIGLAMVWAVHPALPPGVACALRL
eukprot:3871550-Rhodomonas_salina.2